MALVRLASPSIPSRCPRRDGENDRDRARSCPPELDLRTGLELEFDYGVTRYTSFSLPALVQRQDPVEGGGDTRYYARLEPTLGFLVAPHLRLETAYRFRWQTFDDDGGDDSDDATSHAVFVSLAYELPSLYTSR